jgi:hypothetical protein
MSEEGMMLDVDLKLAILRRSSTGGSSESTSAYARSGIPPHRRSPLHQCAHLIEFEKWTTWKEL